MYIVHLSIYICAYKSDERSIGPTGNDNNNNMGADLIREEK